MPAASDGTEPTNIDRALTYARRGWRVVPIPPGEKFPRGITAWQTEGSTDEAKITHWWTQAPGHGIGIVTGATSGLWVLDVDVAGDKVGDETLAYLTDDHTPLPDTFEVITGSGGRHLYFAWPTDGQVITNSASGRLGPGLDVRGEGGFVVAPPSLHANGNRYEVEASAPDHVAPAPKWLLAMLEDPERRTVPVPCPTCGTDVGIVGASCFNDGCSNYGVSVRPTPTTPAGDRPGDLWAAANTWAQILTPDGWTLHHTSRDGEEHWTRPGKERRDGTSATTGYKGSDVLKVFTSSHPTLRADETYTKLGYLAATKHNGDHAAAASALRAAGYGAPTTGIEGVLPDGTIVPAPAATSAPEGDTEPDPDAPLEADEPQEPGDWAPVDLTDVLSGDHQPPAPTILRPRNTAPLLYSGRTNAIFGESGAGKTWIAFAAVAEVITDGGVAMFIDLEDNAHGAISRLRALGLTDDQLQHQFLYLCPQTSWGPQAQAAVAALIDDREPELVVIDSTGEAMAASGVKGNDDDDVARWYVVFPKFIARRGPAVVVIDHVPKDPNAPTKYMIGSQRKTAAIDGASYRVEAVKAPSKTSEGLLRLIVAKDRNGTRSQGDVAAMATVAPNLIGGIVIDLVADDGPPLDPQGKPRHTIYMERVSRLLEETPGLSGRTIESRVEGKAKLIRDALATLLDEGYVERDTASRGFSYVVATPYREQDDSTVSHSLSGDAVSTASHRVPPRPDSAGRGAELTASPAPSPTGQGRGQRPDPDHQNNPTASPHIDAEGTRSPSEPPTDPQPVDNSGPPVIELDPDEDIFAAHPAPSTATPTVPTDQD